MPKSDAQQPLTEAHHKAHEQLNHGADSAGAAAAGAAEKLRASGYGDSNNNFHQGFNKPAAACVKDPDGYIVCGPIVGTPRPSEPIKEIPQQPISPHPEQPMPEFPPHTKPLPFDPAQIRPDEEKMKRLLKGTQD